jgi:hypothetical protein
MFVFLPVFYIYVFFLNFVRGNFVLPYLLLTRSSPPVSFMILRIIHDTRGGKRFKKQIIGLKNVSSYLFLDSKRLTHFCISTRALYKRLLP